MCGMQNKIFSWSIATMIEYKFARTHQTASINCKNFQLNDKNKSMLMVIIDGENLVTLQDHYNGSNL